MNHAVNGVVLREIRYGESDRILTIFTRELGVVSAIAKGSARPQSRLAAATGLFAYANFVLASGKNMYVVQEAQVNNLFFGLRQSVERLASAMYVAEVSLTIAEAGGQDELFEVVLLTLHNLAKLEREPKLIKACFELRAMASTGFLPDIVACRDCAKYEGGAFSFNVDTGELFCADCAAKRGLAPNIEPAVLNAMRHIIYSETAKVFNFTLGTETLTNLANIAEAFLRNRVDKPFKSLDFLHGVLM